MDGSIPSIMAIIALRGYLLAGLQSLLSLPFVTMQSMFLISMLLCEIGCNKNTIDF